MIWQGGNIKKQQNINTCPYLPVCHVTQQMSTMTECTTCVQSLFYQHFNTFRILTAFK